MTPQAIQPYTPETWKPFAKEVWEGYIRWDLEALEDPNRRDQGRIMEDLVFSFRQYGRTFKQVDWTKGSPI